MTRTFGFRRIAAPVVSVATIIMLAACSPNTTTPDPLPSSAAPVPTISAPTPTASPSMTPSASPTPSASAIPTPTATSSTSASPKSNKPVELQKRAGIVEGLNEDNGWACGDDMTTATTLTLEKFGTKKAPEVVVTGDRNNEITVSTIQTDKELSVTIRPNTDVYGGVVNGSMPFLIPETAGGDYASALVFGVKVFEKVEQLDLCIEDHS